MDRVFGEQHVGGVNPRRQRRPQSCCGTMCRQTDDPFILGHPVLAARWCARPCGLRHALNTDEGVFR
jgi:hypothetical protein